MPLFFVLFAIDELSYTSIWWLRRLFAFLLLNAPQMNCLDSSSLFKRCLFAWLFASKTKCFFSDFILILMYNIFALYFYSLGFWLDLPIACGFSCILNYFCSISSHFVYIFTLNLRLSSLLDIAGLCRPILFVYPVVRLSWIFR